MAAVPNAVGEEDAITCIFDLGNLFDQNDVEVNELDGTFVGDSDLLNLINDVSQNQSRKVNKEAVGLMAQLSV